MNKIILSGRLTRDPEVKTAQSGKAYTRVGIAVDRRFSKDKEADFFTLVAFGKTAEFLGNWFSKGSKILVEGSVQIENYEDREGLKHTSVNVMVDAIEFADSKKKSSGGSGGGASASGDERYDSIEDVPF